MGLDEYSAAMRMRSIIERICRKVINSERPLDKIARVVDIDRGAGFASVVYAGDEATALRVKMYPGIQPQSSDRVNGSGNGSIVRISGPVGSRFITDVLSDSPHQESPRLYQPSFASAGTMESTIYGYFSLGTTGAPPADATTKYYTAVMNFPHGAAKVNIYTEVKLLDGTSYIQTDTLKFDGTTAKNTDLSAMVDEATSAGMYMSYVYHLYDGELDGEPAGTVGMTLAQLRDTGSTKSPVSSNVMLVVFATDAKLIKIVDGISLT
ncbi:hypothetical protein AB0F25_30545 [Streptomyces wedmorensis]|uniref:hypothetical protein n=1 Tax=Streptomyces wedmorensis TaxID=43759 RepID=UPI003437997B